MVTQVIAIVACHGALGDFVEYTQMLKQSGFEVQIHASGPALEMFKNREIEVKTPFSLEKLTSEQEDALAMQIAKACSVASVVLTDVGHIFAKKVHEKLEELEIPHIAYYDNRERLVLGGYSAAAASVMEASQGVFFADSTLATGPIYREAEKEVEFGEKKRVGIGHYSVTQAEALRVKRENDHAKVRREFLQKQGIEDVGQSICVYFGGANTYYAETAFPAFLTVLGESLDPNMIVVLQQHPRMKNPAEFNNLDARLLTEWAKTSGRKAIVSDFDSNTAQVLADVACYNQTTMGPQFVWIGLPTALIGDGEDLLTRNELISSIKDEAEFKKFLEGKGKIASHEDLLKALHARSDSLDVLKQELLKYKKEGR